MGMPYGHIAIIGLGLVGGSLAAAISKQYPTCECVGVDVDSYARTKALEQSWVRNAYEPNNASFHEFLASTCDLVVLAVPASVTSEYFALLEECKYTGTITDTSSTKTLVCSYAEQCLSDTTRFIPGHPMAGSEVNGIDGARSDLFDGAHWILCPNDTTDPEVYTALHDFLVSLSARVITLPREEHDAIVAVVSHVPHIVASALVELAARHADTQQTLFRLAAGGFKDSTRIAAGSPVLWSGIAFDNKEALEQGLDEITGIIQQFKQALVDNNRDQMTDLLESAAKVRRGLPAKWVPSTDNLLEVRVPMENRTGVIAEVTSVASKVGCNIQSIEIDHVTADSAVLSMILTDEGDVGKLSTELISHGFTVSLSPLSAKE